jgi:hypothetical protein
VEGGRRLALNAWTKACQGMRALPDRGRKRYLAATSSGRILTMRALWECGPPWAIAAGLIAIVDALLPNATAIMFGQAVVCVPKTYATRRYS